MNANEIARKINSDITREFDVRVWVEEQIDSTNKLVKEKAIVGDDEGLVVVACEQTAGRGRREHTFFSPANTGLYMSLLIRPKMEAEETIFVMPMAAVAVAEAIEEVVCGREKAQIKWVNDIYVDDKKVCGILVEGVYDSSRKELAVVVGIGINVFEPEGGFPEEIADRATAIFANSDVEDECVGATRELLAATVINHFFEYYQEYNEKKIIKEYTDRSCVIGKRINVFGSGAEFEATAKAIDERGRLVVVDLNGDEHVLENDDISIRPV